MLQTAEGIRAAGHPDWFQLVGLLHDMGKIQYLWGHAEDGQEGTADGDQWALGGDTWVVGCKIPDSVVFPEYNATNADMNDSRYNTDYGMYEPHCGFKNLKFAWGHDEYLYQMLKFNETTIPDWGHAEDGQEGTADGDQWALGGDTWVVGSDMNDSRYNTDYGMYEPHCGFKNLKFAWGHDEYLYQMLKFNETTIPDEGLAMIRYHSCYPWHNKKEYTHLMSEEDEELLDWVLEFNKFDLYTKADVRPDVEKLWPYYQDIIDKYLPGKLCW
ncbi:Inositol oxygenase [Phytophthora palmivora]|uniref:Inositol oxygenase n=1 Tax=Phytophthora palmivora TaxID=4796 RepID=A0A2P4XDA5_9STRA|nr:Inositol oxygenase [Phytophthora palmivora]